MSETCVDNSRSMGRLFGQPVVTPHSHSSGAPGLFMSPGVSGYDHSALTIDTGSANGLVAHRPGGFYSRGASGDGNDVVGKPSLGMGIGMNGASGGSPGAGHRRSHSGDFNDGSITVGDLDDSSTASPTTEPHKKKQKRNKPTLSCFECVERKTKVCIATSLIVSLMWCNPPPSARCTFYSYGRPST